MAVDQICLDNPGRVVAMEWHLRPGYPLYLAEASQKMRLYPPPQNGLYYTPWLWLDGRQRGSGYSGWANMVNEQLAVPTDVDLALGGSYEPGSRSGVAVAVFTNAGAQDLTATANVIVTEDSIQYAAPNGDQWHNHVCRDFVPDQYGTVVTVPAGGADTLEMPYTIDPSWDESRCKIVVFLQSTEVQPDSTRPVYQGGEVLVLSLTGVAEQPPASPRLAVASWPSPARDRAGFRFAVEPGARYRLEVFSPDGRLVRRFAGTSRNGAVELEWDRTGAGGRRVSRGVYAWRLESDSGAAAGKLVLAD